MGGEQEYGAVVPVRFTPVPGEQLRVEHLRYEGGMLRFEAVPVGGAQALLGRYALLIQGTGELRVEFEADGATQEFAIAASAPGWSFGDVVFVRLRPLDTPPYFNGDLAFEVVENVATVNFIVDPRDRDGDAVTLSIVGGPDASLFTTIANDAIVFRSAPDFEIPHDLASTDPAAAAEDNVYVVVVRARAGGEQTDRTVTVTVTDASEKPGTVTGLQAVQSGRQTVNLTWNEAGRNGGPAITGYDVQRKRSTETEWTNQTHSGTGNTAETTGHAFGGTYSYRVRAKNGETPADWQEVTLTLENATHATASLGADASGVETIRPGLPADKGNRRQRSFRSTRRSRTDAPRRSGARRSSRPAPGRPCPRADRRGPRRSCPPPFPRPGGSRTVSRAQS